MMGALPACQDTPGPRLQWPLLCLFIGGWVGSSCLASGHPGQTIFQDTFWSRLGGM